MLKSTKLVMFITQDPVAFELRLRATLTILLSQAAKEG